MEENRSIKLKKLMNYIENTSELSFLARMHSLGMFDMAYESGFDSSMIPHYIYAVYDACGIIPMKENRYDTFVDLFEHTMDINQDILEVGGGTLPRVGIRIAQRQINGGTITVYDKQMYSDLSPLYNLKLYRSEFTYMTDIKRYSTIMGLFPCQVMDLMIYRSLEEKKNFFIQMCKCSHPVNNFPEGYYDNPLERREALIKHYRQMAEQYGRDLELIDSISPIIYSKKIK